MTVRVFSRQLLALWAAVAFTSLVAAEDGPETRRTFSQCFLYRGPDGHVWVGHPLVSLGMIGVNGRPPVYRLSPPLAGKLGPLVNELKDAPFRLEKSRPPAAGPAARAEDLQRIPTGPQFWFWGLPRARDPETPFVLVDVEAEGRKCPQPKAPKPRCTMPDDEGPFGRSEEFELISVQLVSAEFISSVWRRAWDDLDGGLTNIVKASRTAPSREKRTRLLNASEKSSAACCAMRRARVSDESRAAVARIAPQARVVRSFQSHIEAEWGGQLRQYVSRLRLTPPTPLPPEPKACPKLELLAASGTPADFLAKVRGSWPEETLDESLLYSPTLKRIVFVWQVQEFSEQQFAALQAQAREQLARAEQENKRRAAEATAENTAASGAIEPWGVVLRPGAPDVLAEKGLLAGLLVEKAPADRSDVPLRAGDVILGYDSVYDLVMGAFADFSAMSRLRNMARYGGKVDVLRGDRLLTLKLPRSAPPPDTRGKPTGGNHP